ncbi:MAG TPA: ABC transporter substrate-binding protein [Nitrospiria bacterium]|nr:ABC transporter substrate-binding protein [Nitrospiria bacterium]
MSRSRPIFNRVFLCLVFWTTTVVLQPAGAFSAQVAVIKSQDLLPYDQAVEGFRRQTQTDVVEYNMRGNADEGAKIVEQVKRLKPAAVLAVGSKAAGLAKAGLPGIPLVYCLVIDPNQYGLQNGNVIGIGLEIPVQSQFKTFITVAPALKRIGVLYDPTKTSGLIRSAEDEARRLKLELVKSEVRTSDEIPGAIQKLLPQIQGLWMVPDSTVITNDSFQFILLETLEKGVPFMAFSDSFVKAGALLALSPDYTAIGKQSSALVDQVIRSGVPDQGKVIYPETARLTINLKTARILGLAIPEEILKTADEVIQ